MNLAVDTYKNMKAPAFCADPFFQEWVFHPLGPTREFFLRLLISHSNASMQLQIAQDRLLRKTQSCTLMRHTIEQYTLMKGALEEEKDTQVCFMMAQDCLSRIKKELQLYEFATNEQEIHFFKVLKPLFIAEREYYSLLHQAELFSESIDGKNFWERQPVRMEKFKAERAKIISAYTSGECRYDEWWYCRGEFRDRAMHDDTVGVYLGLVRYMNFVNHRIINVKG